MSAIPRHVIEGWRRQLAAHQLVDGRCRVCDVPHRCRPWAEAFGELVARGLLIPDANQP